MAKTRKSLLLSLLLLILCAGSATSQTRELLYQKSVSGKLQEITEKIRNPKSDVTPCDQLTRRSDYFVRIAKRKYIIRKKDELEDRAGLGAKPFVFMTTPESVFGLSLLDIYLGIGYEAEDIIRSQRDEEMVLIVFRYPKEIAVSNITNGLLPDDWSKKVYTPTWENMFALFHRLAKAGPVKQRAIGCETTLDMSQAERDFVLGFPDEGKRRITRAAYAELKAAGGPDWIYRNLLEQKMSLFEHFRGNGHTQNEVRDPEGIEAGLLEFVGPNCKLEKFTEIAIISLGQLTIKDNYGAECKLC
jgi:hypothetical protein